MHAGRCARSCKVVSEQGRAAAVNNDANMTEHLRELECTEGTARAVPEVPLRATRRQGEWVAYSGENP